MPTLMVLEPGQLHILSRHNAIQLLSLLYLVLVGWQNDVINVGQERYCAEDHLSVDGDA